MEDFSIFITGFQTGDFLSVGSHKDSFEKMLSCRGSACQATPRRLPEAIRVAAAARTGFSSSDGNSELEDAQKKVFGAGQTAISRLVFYSASKVSISRARDGTLPKRFDLSPHL